MIQRQCACGGTCSECQKKELQNLGVQRSLKVNAPGDRWEREADQMADIVMRSPDTAVNLSRSIMPEISPVFKSARVQRKALSGYDFEDEAVVQRKEKDSAKSSVELGHDYQRSVRSAIGGSGKMIEPKVRGFMESQFHRDFSDVKVHTNSQAVSSATAVNANAYAVGNHIVFGANQYQPETTSGRRLLAHELTHVVQQTNASPLRSERTAGPTMTQAKKPMVARNALETNTVLSTGQIANVHFFPAALAGTRVGPVSGRGGLIHDSSSTRVSVVVDRITSIQGLAAHLLPLWNTATPYTAPGSSTPVSTPPLTVDELAKGLLVYNRYYLPVPSMANWKVGLRFPLPIRIDQTNNEGVLHPLIIRSLASSFDSAWQPLLSQMPAQLTTSSNLSSDVSTFLTANPSTLSRGIALGARAITNAQAEKEFILEVFNQVGQAGSLELALEMMDFLVNHQISLLASQPGGSDILNRLSAIFSAAPGALDATQQASLTRANGMLGRVSAIMPFPQACDPARKLVWGDFAGAVPASNFGAMTAPVHPFPTTTVNGITYFIARLDTARSWVKPRSANPTDPALNGCGTLVTACETHFNGQAPGTTGATWSLGSPTGCAASMGPNPASSTARSHADCSSVVGIECERMAVAESARLLKHEQGHFDITCVLVHKANAALAAGASQASVATALRLRNNALTSLYDSTAQTNHGCNAAQQAAWEAQIAAGLPAYTVP